MGYYLQVLIGAILLVAVVVPLSKNIKEIKIKNILAAIAVMIGFGFLLLSEYVAGFFAAVSAGVAKLSSATAEGTSFLFGSLLEPFLARITARIFIYLSKSLASAKSAGLPISDHASWIGKAIVLKLFFRKISNNDGISKGWFAGKKLIDSGFKT